YETWYLCARQLRLLDRPKEAAEALKRAAGCAGLKERLDLRAQGFFDLASLHENAGEYAEAEAAFREVAAVLDNPQALLEQGPFSREEIDAQAAETLERLGRVCVRGGRPDQAVEAFKKAQQRDPARAPRLALNLAEVYRARGKPDEALLCIDQYLETQPQSTEAYEKKVELLGKLGRDPEALPPLPPPPPRHKHNTALRHPP